jgi:hypothetical protein
VWLGRGIFVDSDEAEVQLCHRRVQERGEAILGGVELPGRLWQQVRKAAGQSSRVQWISWHGESESQGGVIVRKTRPALFSPATPDTMARRDRSYSPDTPNKRVRPHRSSRSPSPTRRSSQRPPRSRYDDDRDRDRPRDRDRDRDGYRDRDRHRDDRFRDDRRRDGHRDDRRDDRDRRRSRSRDRRDRPPPSPTTNTPIPAPSEKKAESGTPPVEDEKLRAKKAKLEAWKKEREAKKALGEAKAKAMALAGKTAPGMHPFHAPKSSA